MNDQPNPAVADISTRILLVEDDAEIADMLKQMLVENGFAAVAAGSASEMDPHLRRQAFDVIILDAMHSASAAAFAPPHRPRSSC